MDHMDSLDLNTRLPPRKRLLAGLKKESSNSELSLPARDLFAHLRDLMNSRSSCPDEIIEASKMAAEAAAELATAARATAMEKAAGAVKAKTAAKSALELLASISSNQECKEGLMIKAKSRKKHVPVKLLYKSNQSLRRHETDEELARRLHRSMNSSPRILSNAQNKYGCGENSPHKSAWLSKNSVDKMEEKVVVNSNACSLDKEGESTFSEAKKQQCKSNSILGDKKVKIKQKKLPLSQCNTKDQGVLRELPASVVPSLNGDPKSDCSARNIQVADVTASSESHMSTKIKTMLKCKKIKVSQCSSDSKILHVLCPDPTAAKTSTMVKVD